MTNVVKWQFWKWFFCGLRSRSGVSRLFVDRWIFAHISIGVGLAWIIEVSPHIAARTVLLPLAAVFIGLSFAWVGSAQALLQLREIEKLSEYISDGIQTYIYLFQLAILVILVTLVTWGLAGLEIFSRKYFNPCTLFGVESLLYFLASLTVRECWNVVKASQLLIISRYTVGKLLKEIEKK